MQDKKRIFDHMTGEAMIFRNEHESPNGKWYTYATTVSKKRDDGTYVNKSKPVKFRKGVVLENKTRIDILDSFLTVREYEADGRTQTIEELVVLDFKVVDGGTDTAGFSALSMDDVPF